jgi:hypothetical protein
MNHSVETGRITSMLRSLLERMLLPVVRIAAPD